MLGWQPCLKHSTLVCMPILLQPLPSPGVLSQLGACGRNDICSCLLLYSFTFGPVSAGLPCGRSHDAQKISQLTWKKALPARAPAGGRLWGWALSMLRSMLCSCTGTCAAEPMTPGKLRFSQEGSSVCEKDNAWPSASAFKPWAVRGCAR